VSDFNVNAVVERVVESSAPVPPDTETVTVASVYDYPVVGSDEVVTLSEQEHLQVQHSPDPFAAVPRVLEAREDSEPQPPEATPAAEALAEAEGVDLSEVEGTGKDDKVTVADVKEALDAEQDPPAVEVSEGNPDGVAVDPEPAAADEPQV
jgi:pyruvate dehydrogenase E2 component (dihydrolipoamide acetyltransferase)